MTKPFYITTAIPYVNARPHLGHAFEFVFSDAVSRYKRLKGEEALLLSGSDDNALKNVQAAEKEHVDVRSFIASNTELFVGLGQQLGVEFDVFQRGSNELHHESSRKLWERCDAAGDIYKKSYEGLYCVGCEAFYAPDELTKSGECFEHPGRALETVSEENYFFRLSRYQDELIRLISTDELLVIPETRKNEILSFLKGPLQDISISRSNERAKNWGVPVPGDDTQRMYVWFDALNIYQSGIGFGSNEEMYDKWWPADVHVIGKGILRFHAVYWPAFLMSAKLLLPKAIFTHGYLTIQGQKMSKTLGNVISPDEIIAEFGRDASRYLLLASLPNGSDADIDFDRLREKYNADLANGIGNYASRVTKLAEAHSGFKLSIDEDVNQNIRSLHEEYENAMEALDLYRAIQITQKLISFGDQLMNDKKPWTLEGEAQKRELANMLGILAAVAHFSAPFMPETSKKIFLSLGLEGKPEEWGKAELKIIRGESLFPRLD